MSQKNELTLAENVVGFTITAALVYLLQIAALQPAQDYTWAKIDKHFPSASQYLKS